MTDHFPITPPPDLVEQWLEQSFTSRELAAKAFQAGADQELEACCEWIDNEIGAIDSKDLRTARRPKSLSLKKQALAVVENSAICDHLSPEHETILRQALEQLND